ncbi:unnamed protein product [marine sediment metagenome]|uniref:Uncharacterized protein n=1 Tax=marine sediment metagenome TaxID=412755 RepID=X1AXY3_9ZZZZ
MYRCKKCGNTDYFDGHVSESGKAHISQYEDGELGWAYLLSDENAWSEVSPEKCSTCQSNEIENIDFDNVNMNLNNVSMDLDNFSLRGHKI